MRVEGWEGLLNDHIQQDTPFAWGRNDCALWSADWVTRATGEDFASRWRGRYASEAELMALLESMGLTQPGEIADEALQGIEVAFAQRGDIVLHPQGCLGICNGIQSCFLMERGVTRIRTRDCIKAWKVS
jgi:hypothetical protein